MCAVANRSLSFAHRVRAHDGDHILNRHAELGIKGAEEPAPSREQIRNLAGVIAVQGVDAPEERGQDQTSTTRDLRESSSVVLGVGRRELRREFARDDDGVGDGEAVRCGDALEDSERSCEAVGQ